jgi:hypothetical protein
MMLYDGQWRQQLPALTQASHGLQSHTADAAVKVYAKGNADVYGGRGSLQQAGVLCKDELLPLKEQVMLPNIQKARNWCCVQYYYSVVQQQQQQAEERMLVDKCTTACSSTSSIRTSHAVSNTCGRCCCLWHLNNAISDQDKAAFEQKVSNGSLRASLASLPLVLIHKEQSRMCLCEPAYLCVNTAKRTKMQAVENRCGCARTRTQKRITQ